MKKFEISLKPEAETLYGVFGLTEEKARELLGKVDDIIKGEIDKEDGSHGTTLVKALDICETAEEQVFVLYAVRHEEDGLERSAFEFAAAMAGDDRD